MNSHLALGRTDNGVEVLANTRSTRFARGAGSEHDILCCRFNSCELRLVLEPAKHNLLRPDFIQRFPKQCMGQQCMGQVLQSRISSKRLIARLTVE